MSLINKMLQDLDARGGAGDGALRQQQLHAVSGQVRDRRPLVIAGSVALAAVVVGGGWFGWQYWQSHRAASLPVAVQVAAKPTVAAAPAAASQPAAVKVAVMPPEPKAKQEAAAPAPHKVADTPPAAAPLAASAAVAPSTVAAHDASSQAAAPRDTPGTASTPAERKPARQAAARSSDDAAGNTGTITHDISPKQMAENTYRRGLVALQEGRVNAALADFDRALEIDPRNEAARQTNISLLLEQKRNEDAVRQLRLALGIDPRQPGLAMVLARLQLEKGGPALETLMTTLPYAGNSAEYQAFLAGVLQREQRHTEAADHYREALRLMPQNGVWWMGLGISLQADMHLPEAREAYRRARAANGLSPELQAFIDRKIESLSR
ncbi:tetratricopeptide repeat protein [Rugamonas aquatica]|uniref:Tetratricopeptide repeat protein n=1 Tax=Rugamonas aquatica TaxID=2743357 RepID=A0A6A7N9J9_9BURK|nr:tetratricopeptide repeat protein [Rugamonas aquatica]MQA41780.1 tetratricopeptide repeat protein [Rugamonas aquatica]